MKLFTFLNQSTLIANRLSAIKKYATGLEGVDLSPSQIRQLSKRSSELEKDYKLFEDVLHKFASSESEYEQDKVLPIQESISELYFSTEALIATLINLDDTPKSSNIVSTQSPSVNLPKLDLPKFNGSYDNYLPFCQLFEASVHNNPNLSSVEKFQYLSSCLVGEPLNLIKSLSLTSENYPIAWELLTKRYKNLRRLASLHVNKIIDMTHSSSASVKELRQFVNTYTENYQALISLGVSEHEFGIFTTTLLLNKLEAETRRRFESSHNQESDTIPTPTEVIQFLERECSTLEAARPAETSVRPQVSRFTSKSVPTKQNFLIQRATQSCLCCGTSSHAIYTCPVFQGLNSDERRALVRKRSACFNCLGHSHTLRDCTSKRTCIRCNQKHHSLLHSTDLAHTVAASPTTSASRQNGSSPFVGVTSSGKNTSVVLGTALVHIRDGHGQDVRVRAVLDSAAQASFITERCAQRLKLRRRRVPQPISGISLSNVKTRGVLTCSIRPLTDLQSLFVLDKITSDLPRCRLSPGVKGKLKGLSLADPSFDTPGQVDVLLGADIFAQLFSGRKRSLGTGMPCAFETSLGWVIMGSAPIATHDASFPSFTGLISLLSTTSLDATLKQFWETEEPPCLNASTSRQDSLVEAHYVKTHYRESSGRYGIRLPFRSSHPPLGDSRPLAQRRFLALERKFSRDASLKTRYSDFMSDYIQAGHMSLLTDTSFLTQQHSAHHPYYVVPHHGIFRANSETAKIRVVFDASARSTNGVSLNDILDPGAKLQNHVCDVLLHFRRHSVVFTCDIRQMYRQIKVHPDDRHYQLIYWRDNSSDPLQLYKLNTVTYGVTSAPFLAIRTLHQLAEDEGHRYPRAATIIRSDIFVDDIITGSHSVDDALSLQDELIQLLQLGGFELRKWTSNSPDLLSMIPNSHCETPLELYDPGTFQILGINWNSSVDAFSYHFHISVLPPTKRSVISQVAGMYDPCGWLSPVVFWAKSLVQLLWTLGIEWDDPIPPDVAEKWALFLDTLPILSKVRIPRALSISNNANLQLHGFSDASEMGYAAVVYLRSVDTLGNISVHLVIAKSRVAPLKRVSLPRLELSGAHLLAKLLYYVSSLTSPHNPLDRIVGWCDSTVVLCWIKTPPYRLKTYVANRVAQIQDWVPSHHWKHVTSSQNAADCASRGLMPPQLLGYTLWWSGPSWLAQAEENWPNLTLTMPRSSDIPELKPSPLNLLLITTSQELPVFSKFSSLPKLQRVLAYVQRFLCHLQHTLQNSQGLTTQEIAKASILIWKVVQRSSFVDDLASLTSGKPCSMKLQRLAPFLDDNGLIRAGGRLQHSDLGYESKHPIILPKSHHLVTCLIDHYHLKHLHAGPQLLQALLSREFWILSARSVIRSRVFNCMRCFRCKPVNSPPLMGNLPYDRVHPTRTFLNTGVDYAGPFTIRLNKLRRLQTQKAYLCVFVCFSTKAVHLEIVSDLTSEAFIATLTRFVSRRGLCSNIFSDCGSNFLGTSTKLRRILSEFFRGTPQRKEIEKYALDNSIKFHFNPPAAPHQGGLWEAAVKSAKYHLVRVIGEQVLTFEEMLTLTSRIEAILNSRPMTALSSDPSDLGALTPGHFLVGGPLVALPEHDFSDVPQGHLSRWQLLQSMAQHIWTRWYTEYLHTLQQRSKWTERQKNLEVGTLVLVHEPDTPPLSWCLGRIISTSPGPDGVVRVARLRTLRGEVLRPAIKLFPLPLQ